jgi:hypothetical protein
MNKVLVCFLLIITFVSCKTKQLVVGSGTVSEKTRTIDIINAQEKLDFDFETLDIRSTAKYRDGKQSQSVSADIRIKKDEVIWINIKFLGFPAAKALITPTRVSYYEKINNTYFDGDFELISNWLGTPLDFQKVQNILLGHPVDALTKDMLITSLENNLYHVKKANSSAITTSYSFEPQNFLLRETVVKQEAENQSLQIKYPRYQSTDDKFVPEEIAITATQKEPVFITINYKSITFNEAISYPFEIPQGYTQITIKK